MKTSQKTKSGDYWDDCSDKMETFYVDNPFFQYKKRELLRLSEKWGQEKLSQKILKTDLYEEALGYDHFLFDLAKNNDQVYGIDISPKIVELAAKRGKQLGLLPHLLAEDVKNLSFKDKSFDLIISNSTLDHFPEIDVALKELNRILKDDGVLILTLHNRNNPLIALLYGTMNLMKRYQVYAEGTYSLRQTKKLMKEAGFVPTDSTGIINIPPVLPTFINLCYRKNILKKTLQKTVDFFEFVGKKNTPLNYVTGYLIAVRGTKKC